MLGSEAVCVGGVIVDLCVRVCVHGCEHLYVSIYMSLWACACVYEHECVPMSV